MAYNFGQQWNVKHRCVHQLYGTSIRQGYSYAILHGFQVVARAVHHEIVAGASCIYYGRS